MLPVLNLYGDKEHCSDLGRKWYFHEKDGCHRGPVNFGLKEDLIDIEKTDTCELVDEGGNLVGVLPIFPYYYDINFFISQGYEKFPILFI